MTYAKPAVERVNLIGQMFGTQSMCEGAGGTWIPQEQRCKREIVLP